MSAAPHRLPHLNQNREHYIAADALLASDRNELLRLIGEDVLEHLSAYARNPSWARAPASRPAEDFGWIDDAALYVPYATLSLALPVELLEPEEELGYEEDEPLRPKESLPLGIHRHCNVRWERLDDHAVLGHAMQLGVSAADDELNRASVENLALTLVYELDRMLHDHDAALREQGDNVVGWCLWTLFMHAKDAAELCAPSVRSFHAALEAKGDLDEMRLRHYTLLSSMV